MSDSWATALDCVIDEHLAEIVAMRRHLHAHPEPSGEEHETSLYLYQALSDRGFEVRMGPEGRGVIADLNGEDAAKRIAIRADIDALRIQDRKTTSYCSQNPGIMHACGHDAHTAMAYGALIALQKISGQDLIPWKVCPRGIFQPSEETALGAADMIGANALDQVQAILATHVDPTRPVGQIGVRPGVLTANCDAMRLTICGQGGHAARPHESKDPIAAAAQLITTLYLFVPRATDSQDAVVVTIGQISGGDNPNVIPEQVVLKGTLRTLDQKVRRRTIEHIRQAARGIEELSGTEINVAFEASVGSVENDPQLVNLVCQAAGEVIGSEQCTTVERPSMGSEDFAAYLEHVPGAMFRLGCANGSQPAPGLHTPTFDIDEQSLAIGAKILARTAVLWSAQLC